MRRFLSNYFDLLLLVVTARQIYSLFSVVAVFAARCYASAASAIMRCLSVCLSRLCFLSKRINISSFSTPSGSQTILVFLHQTSWQYSDENSHSGVSNAGGVARNRDCEPIYGSIACCQHCNRLDVINTVPRDRGKLLHLSLVVSGGVC